MSEPAVIFGVEIGSEDVTKAFLNGFVKDIITPDELPFLYDCNCFEYERDPSIELIQWDDNFLMVVNSACLIGSYKALLPKEAVIRVLGIKLID